jgi:(p)ppGpp synthase/HD superfamily hydrolase
VYTVQPVAALQTQTEKLLAMLVALGDARVMLIKLADRLQQARSMHLMTEEGRKEFVLVTEAVFVHIANRLGIWCIKAELEDLCFKVLPKAISLCTLSIQQRVHSFHLRAAKVTWTSWAQRPCRPCRGTADKQP